MVKSAQRGSELRSVGAGLLAWLVPGLGHFSLGQYWRGAIFLAAVTTTYWGGVAIGGVKNTVDPKGHPAWFVATLCTAGNTAVGLVLRSRLPEPPQGETSPYLAVWPADDIGLVYCGVAGLLNVLVILDAIGRGSLRTRSREPVRPPPGRKGAG
jgi:hypothetical protein